MLTDINVPEMTIEKREGKTHQTFVPNLSHENLCYQLSEAIMMNGEAKNSGWSERVLTTLNEYIPLENLTNQEIKGTMLEFARISECKLFDWRAISDFVSDDECNQFFDFAHKYVKKLGMKPRTNDGFIDGSGIGYADQNIHNLKPVLEEAFDEKYYWRLIRPVYYAWQKLQINLIDCANNPAPNHWSMPAGHGAKFFQVVKFLKETYFLTDEVYRKLVIIASVFAHGRTGNLIHYMMDNFCSGFVVGLDEWANLDHSKYDFLIS